MKYAAHRAGSILLSVLAVAMPLAAAHALVLPPAAERQPDDHLLRVDQGCGPGWWRGPWGHCRNTPFSGRLPGGGFGTNVGESYWNGYSTDNGCPPGWWRGPWGHCRDTPYHGRLPYGSWQ